MRSRFVRGLHHVVAIKIGVDTAVYLCFMDTLSDVLGSRGREALNACVKVKIYGRPERQKYDREQALDLLGRCYEGLGYPLLCDLHSKCFTLPNNNGGSNREEIFDIFDIHDALVRCDGLPYVEKYPRPGPRCDEVKELIDKNRAAIEKECQETTDNLQQYSWFVARRLVRDCFAGGFPRDQGLVIPVWLPLPRWRLGDSYSIHHICNSVCFWDNVLSPELFTDIDKLLQPFGSRFYANAERQNRESIAKDAELEKHRIEQTGGSIETGLYSGSDAAAKVKGCYINAFSLAISDIFPFKPCEDPHRTDSYSIIDIDQAVKYLDGKKAIQKYPENDCPGSDDLKSLIDKCSTEVDKEFNERSFGVVKYSLIEAERRVRDCFAGPGPVEHAVETDVLVSKKDTEEKVRVSKANQKYNIFEIKSAVDCLDSKKLGDLLQEGTYEAAIKARAEITDECKKAFQRVEIDHGSGIIVHEHFVVTNKHVIEDVMNDASKEVSIFNAAIGECPCEVVHCDAKKDLALLCSKDGLNFKAKKISPLQLCSQSLLPGMQIFAFGFPMSHTGETALFVTGHVSGSKVNLSGQTFAVLNCSLNSGNSGGPILCCINGQLKVVGVAVQKHFKDILTVEERLKIEKIRESYQTSTISGVSDEEIRSATSSNSDRRQIPLNLLTLKLYNALETHSQFNLSNAVPGCDVIDFIKDALLKYNGQHKEELSEILQWSDTRKLVSVLHNFTLASSCQIL